jgi:phosphotransferase system  glucose/maltose/N-acetylglucosamine-specific IIC component
MWIIIGIGALSCAILAYILHDVMIIISTAVSGAYLGATGVSYFVGGFPSVIDIYNMIKNGTAFTSTIWIYIGCMAFVALIGMVVQCKYLKSDKRAEADENRSPYGERMV